ncbi:MAG: gamma carbonic anhydrase family protein, partial [Rhodococcus sp. (in: high G+C Gram-positive bacteria)]
MTNPIIATVLGNTPQIDESAFIAPNATVVGAVTIAAGASIWYGAVLRGDAESISIGADTNIQDNCTVHADPTFPAVLGERISVGHNAVLHG